MGERQDRRRPSAARDVRIDNSSPREREANAYAARRNQKSRRTTRIALAIAGAVLLGIIAVAAFALLSPRRDASSGSDAGSRQEAPVATQPGDGSAPKQGRANDGSIVMTLAGSKETYLKQGESYVEGGCYAHDKKDGFLTDKVKASGSVDPKTVGDYTVTYTVENSAGMQASAERTVHVVAASDMDWDKDGVSVFMYHDVYDAANPPEGATSDNNMISDQLLDEQLAWLQEGGYYYPSWAELRAYIDGTHSLPAKTVVLTFDDAADGFLKYGIPKLEKHRVPATSFIICNVDDFSTVVTNYASSYVTYQSHSFGLHEPGRSGKGHGGKIYDLSVGELTADLKKAADMLQSSNAFAYPFGDVSEVSAEAVKDAGILCAFTTVYGQVHVGDNPAELKRIRVFGTYDLASFKFQAANGAG